MPPPYCNPAPHGVGYDVGRENPADSMKGAIMPRVLARWATRRRGVELRLVCDAEAVEGYAPHGGDVYGGALPRYTLEEYTGGHESGTWVFSALDDSAAMERVADRIAAGVYTPTGAKNPPELVHAVGVA